MLMPSGIIGSDFSSIAVYGCLGSEFPSQSPVRPKTLALA